MNSSAIINAFGNICVNANLLRQGTYGIRRGTANHMDITLGRDLAERVLNHERNGSLHHYVQSVGNTVDMVATILGETPLPFDKNTQVSSLVSAAVLSPVSSIG